jgi:ribosomal protein S18 acetylase RimI-like enzyme
MELNDWLRQVASQHQKKGLSKTFVAVHEDQPTRVCAFYALTLAELDSQHLPDAWRKKMPRRAPGVRLGRLAVDLRHQSKGLGEMLLVDALTRAQRVYQQADGIGLFVDVIDDEAASFYKRYGFAAAPNQPLLLLLPVQSLGKT